MLTVAQRGALRDDFRYGADGARTRSWGADGSRVYLPGYEHRLDTSETKVYIGDYAVITSGGGNPRKVEYLLKDRLGSVDAVANASGTVTETRGYDAFGKPRSGTWADLTPPKLASTNVTPKGFTQHEHLNQLELIHMNGRVFDYNVGRFTGVDPFIQFPLNSQSLNPYSYILNNPLSGTDPTGYLIQGEMEELARESRDSRVPNPCEVKYICFAAGDSNGAKNGDKSTTEKRDQSSGGVLDKLSNIGSSVKNAILGPIPDYLSRGEPGSFGDHATNAGKWAWNTFAETIEASEAINPAAPVKKALGLQIELPRLDYNGKGLATPATLQVVSLVGAARSVGTGLAKVVKGTGKARAAVADDVAEAGASLRQPAAGRGADAGLGPHAPGDVPNGWTVVKGGTNSPPTPGTTYSGSIGRDLPEAAAGVPHNPIWRATAGEIRQSGGTVEVLPELHARSGTMNYQHVNVVETFAPSSFRPTGRNPVPNDKRIGGTSYGE
jgi:RHS repeat-associated protein